MSNNGDRSIPFDFDVSWSDDISVFLSPHHLSLPDLSNIEKVNVVCPFDL